MLSPVFRAKDAATAQAMYHVTSDMLRDCCPKAAVVAEEAEPDALAYLGIPAFALEAPAHEQRAGARQPRDKAPAASVVQVFPSEESLERLVGAAMCEQDLILVGIALLRARQDAGALRRRARRVAVRPWEDRGRAHGRGEKDDPREPRACGKGRGGVAYPARFQVKARAEAPPCLELPFARAAFGGSSLERLTPTSATLPHVQKG